MAIAPFLDDVQANTLQRIARETCTRADIDLALARYPGALGADSTIPTGNPTLEEIVAKCVAVIANENAYFSHSFILRLIEQAWTAEPVRRRVVTDLPILVQPPPDLVKPVTIVAAGLEALAQRLPATPSTHDLGDVETYRRICDVRPDLEAAALALERFDALKGLHDALHMLQVFGATALDTIPSRTAPPAVPLPRLLEVVEAAANPGSASLPADCADSCARCLAAATDARQRIVTGDPVQIAYACSVLRPMLMRELPLIDTAMFDTSREFPLRNFHRIFGEDPARDAAIELGDTLRRRLMQHGLWQTIDGRLYSFEQALADPQSSAFLKLAGEVLNWTLRSLRILFDPGQPMPVVDGMFYAVLNYSMATDPRAAANPAVAAVSIDDVRGAFTALRDASRSAFLNADKRLMHDFNALLALRHGIQELLSRVPSYCSVSLGFLSP